MCCNRMMVHRRSNQSEYGIERALHSTRLPYTRPLMKVGSNNHKRRRTYVGNYLIVEENFYLELMNNIIWTDSQISAGAK